MEDAPTGSMPSSTLFGIVEQQGDGRLSLNEFVGFDSPSVFAYEISGNAMAPLIIDGDRLIIDRSKKAVHGTIAVFEYNGQILCRRYFRRGPAFCLMAENKSFKNIIPRESEIYNLIGIVKHVLRSL